MRRYVQVTRNAEHSIHLSCTPESRVLYIHTQPSSHVHACVSVCAYGYNTADREKLNEGPNDVINKTYDVRVTNERLHVTKNHN